MSDVLIQARGLNTFYGSSHILRDLIGSFYWPHIFSTSASNTCGFCVDFINHRSTCPIHTADQVLAALSGVRPTQPDQAAAQSNLHMHPSAQPVQRSPSV